MRYFLRISFNGSPFHGWQIQQNADSVQAHLNQALKTLLRREIETTGCGRTDTGVHAKEFYAHFDHDDKIEAENFVHQLNSILSRDIAVHAVFPAGEKDHARFSAVSRTYKYMIYHEKNPFMNDRAWLLPAQPDISVMNSLIPVLTAHSDFSCFSKSNTQTLTNICRISGAEWYIDGECLVFKITADRFLRNMVRAIVGTMISAGQGKLTESGFVKILESKDRKEAGVSVPAHGLYLEKIIYPFKVY